MTIEVNGIAHIQLTVANGAACLPFWEALCNFIEMKTLVRNDTTVYCIGSRTGILVKEVPKGGDTSAFDQYRPGLHHLCLRARSREDIDHIYAFVLENLDAKIIHGPEDGIRDPLWSRGLGDVYKRQERQAGSAIGNGELNMSNAIYFNRHRRLS